MELRKMFRCLIIVVAMLSSSSVISAQQKADTEYFPTIIAGVRKADSWTMENT